MAEPLRLTPPSRVPFWRRPEGRAWIFQITLLAALIGLALFAYANTLENLKTRGISSGFGFLSSEAGFRIGEASGVLLPRGGILWVLASLGAGLLVSRIVSKPYKKAALPMPNCRMGLCLLAGLGLPLLTLYLTRDSVEIARYTASSSYLLALATGLVNTLKVTVIGCVASTVLGLGIALGRLSPNWLLSRLCRWYVELNRNLPLLLQLFFWYFIVLQQLPGIRQSIDLGGWLFLNKRGLFIPALVPQPSAWLFCGALILSLCLAWLLRRRVLQLRDRTGATGSWIWQGLGLIIGLPALVWVAAGTPFSLDMPMLKGFNFKGGTGLTPEFTALVTGLTVYVSAFNAEIIRAGIQSVSRGQREAARAIAMTEGQVMRVVVLPQAMRVILPPMTGEYLAIAKNSSLAVAIGYPEFVSIGGTILNQSGQAVEIVGIWMGVYLIISLAISLAMNLYNTRVALKEK